MPSRSTYHDAPDANAALRDQVVLGRALRELRDRAGITQEQLAGRIGIDITYVSRVERGKRGVRWHTVMRFLRALDASVWDFATLVEEHDRASRG
jgi:transcriptional regulator with XRE-family HTH domain